MSFAILNEGVRLLPAFCKPYPDELLSSWITRMAFKHALSTSEFCRLIWPGYNAHPDVDRYISDQRIRELAEQTNCSFEEVMATTLWSFEETIFEKMHRSQPMENWLIHCKNAQLSVTKQLYSTGLMFCPRCLKNKIHFKKQWRLAMSFACLDCGCYLAESCPHCGKGNSFMEKISEDLTQYTIEEHLLNCHYCGMDVTVGETVTAPDSIIRLQKDLYEIVQKGYDDGAISSASYFTVLYYLASFLLLRKNTIQKHKKFIMDVFDRNGLSAVALYPFDTKEVHDLPVQKRAIVIKLAYWLLSGWPDTLLRLCIKHDIYVAELLRPFKKAPFWFSSAIIDGLENPWTHKELEEIEDEIEEVNIKQHQKVKQLKKLTYDLDFDNYHYAVDEYDDSTLSYYTEKYLYEMSMCYMN